MAAPDGVPENRWRQARRAFARETGVDETTIEAWMLAVWDGMWTGDELPGHPEWRDRLALWLARNAPADACTLPRAFRGWALG